MRRPTHLCNAGPVKTSAQTTRRPREVVRFSYFKGRTFIMSTFPNSPRLVKGGIVALNTLTSAIERVISLQYNPDTISRTFQIKGTTGEAGDRSEALRLTGPPVETIK